MTPIFIRVFILVGVGMLVSCQGERYQTCRSVSSKLQDKSRVEALKNWVDESRGLWALDQNCVMPKYPFGRGDCAVDPNIEYLEFGFLDRPEAQIVFDEDKRVRVVQFVDSNNISIIVAVSNNDWYAWQPYGLKIIDERVAVICSKRD